MASFNYSIEFGRRGFYTGICGYLGELLLQLNIYSLVGCCLVLGIVLGWGVCLREFLCFN